jgi:hypothetical protein
MGTKDGYGVVGMSSSICPDCLLKHCSKFIDGALKVRDLPTRNA